MSNVIVQHLASKNEPQILHILKILKILKNNLDVGFFIYKSFGINFVLKLSVYSTLMILEEFLSFLFQNLFISIGDSIGQSYCTNVILIQNLKLFFVHQYQIIYSSNFL